MERRNRLKVVSDISCDINGSIEFLDRTCTIANPFFQYNPLTREEVCAGIGDKGITVMGECLFEWRLGLPKGLALSKRSYVIHHLTCNTFSYRNRYLTSRDSKGKQRAFRRRCD